MHPNPITQWRYRLLYSAAAVFDEEAKTAAPADVKMWHAKIGELTFEKIFLPARQGRPGF